MFQNTNKGGDFLQRPRGDNQQRILDYIKTQIQEKGYPPSVRQIAQAVGLKSTSTVHGHLQRLEKKGLIHRDTMKPRAMEVVGGKVIDVPEGISAVPVVGHVQAGIPILAEENLEDYVQLPEVMLGRGKHFILRVHGNSMINAGIMDDDYIIVRETKDVNNGDIIVAMIDDACTVKRFYRQIGGMYRLQPENDEMEPIYTRRLDVIGLVVSMFRLIK